MDRLYTYPSSRLVPTSIQSKSRQVQVTHGKFDTLLKQQLEGTNKLKISKHAEERLHERGILIEPEKWNLIQKKINEARQKGVNDSLVILENATLIVNAKNHTVITAMNRHEADGLLFTNINGTILID